MNVRYFWDLLKDTYNEWSKDNASDQAAALAYYSLFSIAPLLVVIVSIAGFFYENSTTVRDAIIQQIAELVGNDSAQTIQEMMAASSTPGKGLMAMAIGIITLLLGASAVFAHLQSMLNLIWEVEPKEGRGILGTIKSRFFSFTLVVGTGFLLLVSLVISTGLAALNTAIEAYIPGGAVLAYAVNLLISFVVITGIFAMIYKLIPDAAVSWSDVWTGASLTAVLFILGKFLIGLYLGHSSMASAYGAVGSILIILLWVYYSAQILFFGAEFTQVYAMRRGATIKPTSEAVRKQTECTT